MAPSRAAQRLHGLCAACAKQQITRRWYTATARRQYAEESSHLPRIASTSFWTSLIPKPFRRPTDPDEIAERARLKAARSKEWNPGTVFLVLGILVGSNAIQIIAHRNEMVNFSRKTDAKLSVLREVVKRVKNGEDVDIKRALGTGDPQQEAEWEEVMKELEKTDMLEEGRKKRQARRVERMQRKQLEKQDTLSPAEREGQPGSDQADTAQNANERRGKYLM